VAQVVAISLGGMAQVVAFPGPLRWRLTEAGLLVGLTCKAQRRLSKKWASLWHSD